MSDCIEYSGGTFRNGYGSANLWVGGRHYIVYAHRLAYELAHGPIPPGMVVMHTCDNPPCVNADHLRAGTQGDNVRDASSKGRLRRALKTHCKRGHEFTPDNTYFRPEGRQCKACVYMHTRIYREKKKEQAA